MKSTTRIAATLVALLAGCSLTVPEPPAGDRGASSTTSAGTGGAGGGAGTGGTGGGGGGAGGDASGGGGAGGGGAGAPCGDGALTGAEGCDDGNTAAGDGCAPDCVVEDGYACSGAPSACATVCGDGKVVGGEACDDGNLTATDGCGSACQIELGFSCAGSPSLCVPQCGDGLLKGGEECDDGALTPGDGCSAACAEEAGFACVGFPSVCAPVCGDGLVRAPEICDDGGLQALDGCDPTCKLEQGFTCTGEPSDCVSICGDGAVGPDESCDDGNLADGDCCTSTCGVVSFCEIEANETLETATDLELVAPGGAVFGFIGKPGDVDVYALTIPAGRLVSIRAEVGDGMAGTTCESKTLDSRLRIVDASGDSKAIAEDGGVGRCSLATTPVLDPGTYYVVVTASPYVPAATFDYDLHVEMSHCGNGVVELGEECDDATLTNGDGCTDHCSYETTREAELNNADNLANGPFSPPFVVQGQTSNFGDEDFYSFVLPTTADLRIEMWDYAGRGNGAGLSGSDGIIELQSAAGTPIAFDDDSGPDVCPLLDGTVSKNMRRLPPGLYYLRVAVGGLFTFVPFTYYELLVEYDSACGDLVVEGYEECDGGPGCDPSCARLASCGDGHLDEPESCDDGGTTAGDGCDASCQIEAQTLEVEPNGTTLEADARALDPFPLELTSTFFLMGVLGSYADVDLYRLVLSAPTTIHFETLDSSGAECRGGFETALSVLDATGTTLASDLTSGIEGCSALPVTLAAGTYYVRMAAPGVGPPLGSYALAGTFFSAAAAEAEPNDTRATATPLLGSRFLVQGSHAVASDVDYFALQIPDGASLRVEVAEGGAETCESGEVDSLLRIYDPSGRLLVSDDDDGRGDCSLASGLGENPDDAQLSELVAGTYLFSVEASLVATADTTGLFDYRLIVDVREPGCAVCISAACAQPGDCQSGICQNGVCQPSSCADATQNGSESGVDCGGGQCPGCAPGGPCVFDSDCASRVCTGGVCGPLQQSCISGAPGAGNDCGPNGNDYCCTTPLVPGGTFLRSYDNVYYFDASNPATVSDFRLDKYEVTVGRFRQFVDAGKGVLTNPPAPFSGAHPWIANSGWDPSFDSSLSPDGTAFRTAIQSATGCNWTDAPGPNELQPMNCIEWYEAFAFCIWDGGFLPTEAEWNYAAAGGSEQRVYPWSSPPMSTTLSAANAVYNNVPSSLNVGSKSPLGDGRWGHTDLMGNVWEWVLDYYGTFPKPCVDCFNNTTDIKRGLRGGCYQWQSGQGLVSYRGADPPNGVHIPRGGVRCARVP